MKSSYDRRKKRNSDPKFAEEEKKKSTFLIFKEPPAEINHAKEEVRIVNILSEKEILISKNSIKVFEKEKIEIEKQPEEEFNFDFDLDSEKEPKKIDGGNTEDRGILNISSIAGTRKNPKI
jgi:hypothetical protein